MINLEKHREEIEKELTLLPVQNCKNLSILSGNKCNPVGTCEECMHNFVDWLLEEAKTDWSQVEPGTKCLVRDYDNWSWQERQFAIFAFGKPWFFVAGTLDDVNTDTSLFNYTYYKIKEDEE